MKRFILLTFGFLGWAFYEMSGGADFQPASAQMAANADQMPAQENEITAKTPSNDTVKTAEVIPAVATAQVDTTPPGFESTAQADDAERVSVTLTTALNGADTGAATDVSYVPVAQNIAVNGADTPAIIPSLIVPNDSGAAIVDASVETNLSSEADIRSVSGNRVNVRGGPGTEFQVVTKLGRGDSVEIIQDNGDGWVKMRPVDGGPEGWMADFLLSNG
jgi:hypothetical protein